MVDGGEVGIKVLLVALDTRMTCCAVGGRRSHPFVSFSASRCAETKGWGTSEFFNLVVILLKTTVRPVCYCWALLDDAGRLISDRRRNQTRAFVRAKI